LPTYFNSKKEGGAPFNTMLSYDFNLKFNHSFKNRDKFFASVYWGDDNYLTQFREDSALFSTRLGWGNRTMSLRYTHEFKGHIFSNTLLTWNFYKLREDYRLRSLKTDERVDFLRQSMVEEWALKQQFSANAGEKHFFRAGLELGRHRFEPGNLAFQSPDFNLDSLLKQTEVFLPVSGALYAEHEWTPVPWLTTHTGLRYAAFRSKKAYLFLEPRASLTVGKGRFSCNIAYARTNQPIHLLANNTLGLFSDLWVPATEKVAPQSADQISGGFIFAKPRRNLSFLLEGYYKTMGR
jgi:hypothetical protein